jgi:hypothetical protein
VAPSGSEEVVPGPILASEAGVDGGARDRVRAALHSRPHVPAQSPELERRVPIGRGASLSAPASTMGRPTSVTMAYHAKVYGKFPGSQEAEIGAVSPAWEAVFRQRSKSDAG